MSSFYKFLFLLFLLSSCVKDSNISDEEISIFIDDIKNAVDNSNNNFLNNLIDYSVIQNEAKEKRLLKGRKLGVVLELDSYIISEVFSSGDFIIVNKKRINDQTFVLTYRFLSESNFDYFDFVINKIDGHLRITNFFSYLKPTSFKDDILYFLENSERIPYSLNTNLNSWISDIFLKLKYERYEEARKLYRDLMKQYNSNDFSFLSFRRYYACAVKDSVLAKKMTEKLNVFNINEKRFTLINDIIYLYSFDDRLVNKKIDSLKFYVADNDFLNNLKKHN